MSLIVVECPIWKAIMADERLAGARRKLSLHEIRLIVDHARARDRAALVTIRELLAEEAGEPSLAGSAFMIADSAVCPSNPPSGGIALAAAARQGGDGTAPAESPQSGHEVATPIPNPSHIPLMNKDER